MTNLKVIIIGGGIGGLTLARACLDANIEVELYEKRSFEGMLSGPGGIFIQKNAMRVYDLLWEGKLSKEFYQQGGKILKGGFFSQDGTPLYINQPKFADSDDLGICLLRPQLAQILYNSLSPEIVNNQAEFVDFKETSTGVKVTFSNGQTATGDILIGADGLYSKVRARLAGLSKQQPPIYSGMTCWRGSFKATDVPLDKRYSWVEMWGRGDRFGYFDVGGGQWAFYGFKNTPSGGNDSEVGGAKKALTSIFSHYAQPVSEIIESLDEEKIYRDDIFDREPLGVQWGQGRVSLIGDAAHPVQPNLGQGGCQAIEDAYELVRQLLIGEGEDISTLLRRFEASRSQRVKKVFETSRQVGILGQTEIAIGCLMRNWIYRLTPTWLADLQFRWLFDYNPKEPLSSKN